MLDFLLEQSRRVYNIALEKNINLYEESKESFDGWSYFRDLRKVEPEGLGLLNTASLQQTLRRLDKSFKTFFRRVKAGEESPGFPRFKSYDRWKSMAFCYGNGAKLISDSSNRILLYVQNVGNVKVKYHREIPEESVIKQVVLKRNASKWYACLMIELPDPILEPREEASIGIDMGLSSLLALSNGELVENPRWFRTSEKKLRRVQRKLSRCKKGSKNRKQVKQSLQRIHEHIAEQRKDYWHKVTRDLVNKYTFIAIEDLTLDFMLKNHCLAKSASDAGLGMFTSMLMYKAEEAGTRIEKVNPAYTSQICSQCGSIVKKDLSVRVHKCDCGLVLDRDVNAAINILNLALKSVLIEPPDVNVRDGSMRSQESPVWV
jgi:putative transposase